VTLRNILQGQLPSLEELIIDYIQPSAYNNQATSSSSSGGSYQGIDKEMDEIMLFFQQCYRNMIFHTNSSTSGGWGSISGSGTSHSINTLPDSAFKVVRLSAMNTNTYDPIPNSSSRMKRNFTRSTNAYSTGRINSPQQQGCLRRLSMKGCLHIQDAYLSSWYPPPKLQPYNASTTPVLLLTHLSFQECRYITDSLLQQLSMIIPNLLYLDLRDCGQVTDEGIHAVAAHCPEIEQVRVDGCYQLTNQSLLALWYLLPKKRKKVYVTYTHCPKVTI
jgi:hypothetical protein